MAGAMVKGSPKSRKYSCLRGEPDANTMVSIYHKTIPYMGIVGEALSTVSIRGVRKPGWFPNTSDIKLKMGAEKTLSEIIVELFNNFSY
jgi:hypothetical protein